jgi:uncharacterized protein YndB with AHSA1/START domain
MVARGSGKLKVTLRGDKEILLERVFEAPARNVFKVLTQAEYVRRWWCSQEGFEMTVCDIDLRVGGKWRYAMVGPGGFEVAFHGEYREIAPPAKLVNTEIYEAFPDSPALVTATLEEDKAGKTTYRAVVLHDTKEARDAHASSGMEAGADRCYDLVEELARG